jgi:hypothetical protein
MKKLLSALAFIFFCFTVGNAQMPAFQNAVLEVYESGAGMAAVSGKYLFLRVSDDGSVEYEDVVVKDGQRNLVLSEYQLSETQLREIKSFLDDSEIINEKESFEPDVPTIDHVITFEISIFRNSKVQLLKFTNFYPTFSQIK